MWSAFSQTDLYCFSSRSNKAFLHIHRVSSCFSSYKRWCLCLHSLCFSRSIDASMQTRVWVTSPKSHQYHFFFCLEFFFRTLIAFHFTMSLRLKILRGGAVQKWRGMNKIQRVHVRFMHKSPNSLWVPYPPKQKFVRSFGTRVRTHAHATEYIGRATRTISVPVKVGVDNRDVLDQF